MKVHPDFSAVTNGRSTRRVYLVIATSSTSKTQQHKICWTQAKAEEICQFFQSKSWTTHVKLTTVE